MREASYFKAVTAIKGKDIECYSSTVLAFVGDPWLEEFIDDELLAGRNYRNAGDGNYVPIKKQFYLDRAKQIDSTDSIEFTFVNPNSSELDATTLVVANCAYFI